MIPAIPAPGFVRAAVVLAVTEARGDPLQAGVLIIKWAFTTPSAALLAELQREVGRLPISPEYEAELEKIVRLAEGDDVMGVALAMLHERLDARENPSFVAMVEQHARQQVFRPLIRMLRDEINRRDEEEYRREEARRTARKKPRPKRSVR